MSEKVEFEIPAGHMIPHEIILREEAIVSLSRAAADVRVETVFGLARVGEPPRVTSSCERASTWTFSGNFATGADGTVEIHLNKFLDCLPSVIRDVVVGPNDQPAVGGVIYSNYIGSMPSFTATPESKEPVFLTYSVDAMVLQPPAGQAFLPQALDVKIKVRSWTHDGDPAPKVVFSWIAITRLAAVTNF
jgi:hypothetical protein